MNHMLDAAALVTLNEGGIISQTRLMSLLYRAERNFLSSYQQHLVGGPFVTTDIGPVHQNLYELFAYAGIYGPLCIEDGMVFCNEGVSEESLMELSLAECRLIRETVETARDIDDEALRAQARALPEFAVGEIAGGVVTHLGILQSLGFDDEAASQIADRIASWEGMERMLREISTLGHD